MIEIRNLKKSFKGTTVLDDITLDFYPGHIYGFVGRNGSGKSVLFKCICGLIPYEQGKIIVNSKLVSPDNPPIGKIGALIETPGFLNHLSGKENLEFLSKLAGIDKKHIPQLLDLVNLPNTPKPVHTYSLGMKQRLGLAQALLDDCAIIILDEPMNSLDEDAVNRMKSIIISLKAQNRTILLASHIREDIEQLCDAIIYLSNGRIVKIENTNS